MSSPPAALDRGVRVCLHLGFWVPLAGCTYLALTPAPLDAVFQVSDVVLHALAFTYLTFTLGLAFPRLGPWRTAGWMLGYGLLLEFLQSFEPERAAEVKDLLVDGVGIALGLAVLRWLGGWCRHILRETLALVWPAG